MERWTGKGVSADFAERLARGYAAYARKAGGENSLNISVGWDCRLSSPTLAAGVVRGLRNAGVNALRLGICPAPFVAFSVFHHAILDGGIMVTGASTPADHNGFEFYFRKERLTGARLEEILTLAEAPAVAPFSPGRVADLDVLPLYRRHVYGKCLKVTPVKDRRKILLDLSNGSAATVFPQVLHPDFNVVGLGCTMDGRFPKRHPHAMTEADLHELITEVRAQAADYGVALDADSNRIAVVDGDGNLLPDERLARAFQGDVTRAGPGRFRFGGDYYGYDDGVFAVLRFCEVASRPNSLRTH